LGFNNFGEMKRSTAKFCHVTYHEAGLKTEIQLFLGRGWGVRPLKFGRAKNVQNSTRFRTTFDFDREYIWNGSRYRQ